MGIGTHRPAAEVPDRSFYQLDRDNARIPRSPGHPRRSRRRPGPLHDFGPVRGVFHRCALCSLPGRRVLGCLLRPKSRLPESAEPSRTSRGDLHIRVTKMRAHHIFFMALLLTLASSMLFSGTSYAHATTLTMNDQENV